MDGDIVPPGQETRHVIAGAEAEFQHQPAAGAEDARGIGDETVVDGEAGLTREQGGSLFRTRRKRESFGLAGESI